MPIRYEECLIIQSFVFEKNEVTDKEPTIENLEKGKNKVEEDSDDGLISSLYNRVKVNKRMTSSSKPPNNTNKKVIIQLIHLDNYNINNLLKNYYSYLQQIGKKMTEGILESDNTSLVGYFISHVKKL